MWLKDHEEHLTVHKFIFFAFANWSNLWKIKKIKSRRKNIHSFPSHRESYCDLWAKHGVSFTIQYCILRLSLLYSRYIFGKWYLCDIFFFSCVFEFEIDTYLLEYVPKSKMRPDAWDILADCKPHTPHAHK